MDLYRSHALAYAAGVIDGEGCITIVPSNDKDTARNFYVRVTVGMNDPDAIALLASLWDLPVRSRRGISYFVANSRHAKTVILDVLPYLRVKRSQAAVALKLIARIELCGKYRRLSDQEVAYRRWLFRRCSDLKFRNATRSSKYLDSRLAARLSESEPPPEPLD